MKNATVLAPLLTLVALSLVAVDISSAWGQTRRSGRAACEYPPCKDSQNSPTVDPATSAVMEMHNIYQKNKARREERAYERQLEREQRMEALDAQWDRENEAWRQKGKVVQEQHATDHKNYDAAVDRMHDRQSTLNSRPMFLSKETSQDVMLGYDKVSESSLGFVLMKDQNGNDAGSYGLNSKLSDDGRYLEVEIRVRNATDCKMYFNGYFKKGKRAYDLLDWGNGPELDSRGDRIIRDRIAIGGGSQPADFHSFKPDVAFTDCKTQGKS